MHMQRAALEPPAQVPLERRRVVFFDPGARAGLTGYAPDGGDEIGDRSRRPTRGVSIAYLEADGGAPALERLAIKADGLAAEVRRLDRDRKLDANASPAVTKLRQQRRNQLKRREHTLRERAKNLVTSAHIRIAHDVYRPSCCPSLRLAAW